MKKIFVIMTLWVVSVTFVTAQERRGFGTPEERAKNQTNRLDELVKLTEEQKSKINTVNLELSKKMDAARKENSENLEVLRTTMSEINTERDKQYKTVLSQEQFEKYQENKAIREKQVRERQGTRGRNRK
jgi:Spy/CpxP family protein refolding chaperone